MNDKTARCKNCKYYVPEGENSKYGLCHYHPPVVAKEIGQSQWPVVREKQFCGQFERREEEPETTSHTETSIPLPDYPQDL